MTSRSFVEEVAAGERFTFGRNWKRYLRQLTPERMSAAERSLINALGRETLEGACFLDIGSGSGVFSLAARRLGATVVSFDFDPDSVACTLSLKQKERSSELDWRVLEGSALDERFIRSLGQFDIVYSWGVLHHTGDLWRALDLATVPVKPDGQFFIAIYNDQGWISGFWTAVKRLYNRCPLVQPIIIVAFSPYLFGLRWLARALSGRLRESRGMDLWRDMIDWLGGLPFEVASLDRVIRFLDARGFDLTLARNAGRRHGCNEFVFIRRSRSE